jgi:restriction system protein
MGIPGTSSHIEGAMSSKNRTPRKDPAQLSPTATDAMLNIAELSVADVERLAAAAYRARGYDVRAIKAADGEVEGDLLMTKESQRLLLQCKHWKTRKIGEMPVRELYGAMAGHSASGGVLISSGVFSLEATRFAGFGGIELVDGLKLTALLRAPGEPARTPGARSAAVR